MFFSLLILITLLHNPYESSGRFLRQPVYTDWGSFPIFFLPFPCFSLHFPFLSVHFPFYFLSFSSIFLLPPLLPSSSFPFRLAMHGSVRMLPVMQCFRGTALRVQVDIFSRCNLIFHQLSLVTITCHWKFRSVRHSNNNFCLKIICYISLRVYHGIYYEHVSETSCEGGLVHKSTCYKIHRERVRWFTAVNRFLSNNATLAVFDDDIQTYFTVALLKPTGPLWIGLIKSWWTWPDAGSFGFVFNAKRHCCIVSCLNASIKPCR